MANYLNIQTRNFINEHFSFEFAKLKTFTKIATITSKKTKIRNASTSYYLTNSIKHKSIL